MSDEKLAVGEVPLSAFSGEGPKELTGNANGQVFVSPAYDVARSGNQVDVDSLDVKATVADSYGYQGHGRTVNPRPMLFGPPPVAPAARVWPPHVVNPGYLPTNNTPGFVLVNNKPEVKGVMTDIISGVSTVILY